VANPQSNPQSGSKDTSNGKGGRNQALLAELEQMSSVPPPERRDSFGKAFLQLLLFLAILGGIGGGYYVWAKQAGKVFDTLKEVRDIQRQDSLDKLHEARKKLDEAMAVKSEPRLVSLLAETDVMLACMHLEEDAKADAEKYVNQASSDDVIREERYSAEGYWKICQGQAAAAEEYMARILNKGATQPRIYHALGLAYLAQGKLVEAQTVLKQASEKGPGNPRFPVSHGEVELRLGNWWDSQQQFSRAVNSNGSHTFARLGKALAEGMSGIAAEKVLKDINKALEGTPSQGEKVYGAYAVAEILARGGALKEADTALSGVEKVLGPARLDSRHLLLRGKIAWLKGDEKGADKAFDEAAKREPANPQVYFLPAILAIDAGKGEIALTRLQAYQKAKNTETPLFFSLLGDAHQARGKPEDAAKAYQQALEKEEGNVRSIMGTGRLLIEKKKWEEAGQMLEKVTTMMPDNGDPWFYMGGAYIEQKDFAYASQMSDKAVELYKKRNAEPRYLLRALKQAGKAHELNKDKKTSEERLKEAEALEKAMR
jgi:tetratricopeptide (TPR) repeat protein